MARLEAILTLPAAARIFAPVNRDWERARVLARILGESVLMMGLILALAYWLDPLDPFGLAASFPWVWLGPIILALRYGTIDGALATALLLAAFLLPTPSAAVFPKGYFLGGLVVTLVCGQFADVWNSRLARIKSANAYLDERLVSLTRTHYLIRLSHLRLEQELLMRPVMLRDLLTELRPNVPVDAGKLDRADMLLRLLASSCEIENGAIHAMKDGALIVDAAASIGDAHPLDSADPLVVMALESGRFMHVRSGDASLYRSEYLVAGPVRASSGETLGMLVVRSMPFFALNEENLQFIVVLLGYYADGVMASRAIHPVRVLRPLAPPDFALELVRMKRLHDQARVDSSLVALVFPTSGDGKAAFDLLRRIRRATDIAWDLETAKHHVMVLLMPMSGAAAVDGMLQRFDGAIRKGFGKPMVDAGVVVHSTGMSRAEPEWMLDDLLNRAGALTSSRPANANVDVPII